jgi:glutathione S-transferase
MKLYSGRLSMFGAKVEIALREKAIAFDLTMVAFNRERGYEPKHPEVLRVNPKRQVPVLIDGDVELFDSTQIFESLEDKYPLPALWPQRPAERARARQFEHRSDEVFFPHVIRLMGLRGTPDPVDSPDWIKAREGIEQYYAIMELSLTGHSYLAGAFTYADIAFYMAQFFAARHTVPMTASYPKLLAWRSRVAQRPAVKPVIGTMVNYLRSVDLPVPEFGERENIR